ncbi:MAG TPA: (2Fe-2S) ferredoxin domain-containing protein [Oscillospiraceae bacterium]|nr:(2Fe-2S) ferredoxin domain-containing protein [Oscillospiraceae bacterium]
MKSLEELKAIRDRMQGQVNIREEDADSLRIVVGMATCGIAAGARPVLTAFSDAVQEKGLKNVAVVQTGCVGLCQYEPIVEVYSKGNEKVTYVKMTAEKAKEVIEQHIVGGKIVTKYTINSEKIG